MILTRSGELPFGNAPSLRSYDAGLKEEGPNTAKLTWADQCGCALKGPIAPSLRHIGLADKKIVLQHLSDKPVLRTTGNNLHLLTDAVRIAG